METVEYRLSRSLPVVHQAEVVVVGGGPGGLGAAVMAARAGARTLLVERYGVLGGMACVGEIHPFMANHVAGRPLDGPVYTEWVEAMRGYWPRQGNDRHIARDAAALAAEDLCLAAGVEVLYHHQLADAVMAGRRLESLVLLSKSGFSAVRGRQYVDCTGDGDLAARAGCGFAQGGPSGHCQPMTLCFKLSPVDRSRMPEQAALDRLYDEARQRGEIDCPRENILHFHWLEDDVVHFNTTRVLHRDATSGPDLSAAEIEGRRQLRQFLRFFRTRVPGFEEAKVHSMAAHIGVRESRRVRGIQYLTGEAFEQARKCPDAIARVRYPMDIHNPDGAGTEIRELPEGEWYEIPYGCVVARDADNLLVGGRPISVDHRIHSSMRVMPPATSVGQGAGVGAALAAARRCRPAEISGVEVRQRLVALGAPL
ncbi:MAG: FAD-dependent oxidoreductase [Candidatus Latescibacterota bacterium]